MIHLRRGSPPFYLADWPGAAAPGLLPRAVAGYLQQKVGALRCTSPVW